MRLTDLFRPVRGGRESENSVAAAIEAALAPHAPLLRRIWLGAGVSPRAWRAEYRPAIERYAENVYCLPASQLYHHRERGGLLRHGLEVAAGAMERVDQFLHGADELPERRRALEGGWRYAVFLGGLCHDLGKPVSDMEVHAPGEPERRWQPFDQTLVRWCVREGLDDVAIRWREGRGDDHRFVTSDLLDRVLGDSARRRLEAPERSLLVPLRRALTQPEPQDEEARLLARLVGEADAASARWDLRRWREDEPDEVPLVGLILRAMRDLVQSGAWRVGEAGARVWPIDGALFAVWPAAGEDVIEHWRRQGISNTPGEPHELVRHLWSGGYIMSSGPVLSGKDDVRAWLWRIRPRALGGEGWLEAVRLHDPRSLGMEGVEDIAGDIEPVAPAAAAAGVRAADTRASGGEQGPGRIEGAETGVAASAPESKPGAESGSGVEPGHELQRDPGRDTGDESTTAGAPGSAGAGTGTHSQPRPGGTGGDGPRAGSSRRRSVPRLEGAGEEGARAEPVTRGPHPRGQAGARAADGPGPGAGEGGQSAEQAPQPAGTAGSDSERAADPASDARAGLEEAGLAGQVLAHVAEDLGRKEPPERGRLLREMDRRCLALRYPEAFSGYGVEPKELPGQLERLGWLEMDPYSPLRKIREVQGWGRALVLSAEPAAWVRAIARAAALQGERDPAGQASDGESRDERPHSPGEASANKGKKKQKKEPRGEPQEGREHVARAEGAAGEGPRSPDERVVPRTPGELRMLIDEFERAASRGGAGLEPRERSADGGWSVDFARAVQWWYERTQGLSRREIGRWLRARSGLRVEPSGKTDRVYIRGSQ